MPHRGFYKWPTPPGMPVNATWWKSADGLLVTSELAHTELPGSGGKYGPTWVLAVSRREGQGVGRGVRATRADLLTMVERFALDGWDEDNHESGITRTVFVPCDEQYRRACECKTNEQRIIEADGYEWSYAADKPCSMCWLRGMRQLRGLPEAECPFHPISASA